jgi:hypothetical protein
MFEQFSCWKWRLAARSLVSATETSMQSHHDITENETEYQCAKKVITEELHV